MWQSSPLLRVQTNTHSNAFSAPLHLRSNGLGRTDSMEELISRTLSSLRLHRVEGDQVFTERICATARCDYFPTSCCEWVLLVAHLHINQLHDINIWSTTSNRSHQNVDWSGCIEPDAFDLSWPFLRAPTKFPIYVCYRCCKHNEPYSPSFVNFFSYFSLYFELKWTINCL